MQKVGSITSWGKGLLEVYWNPETRQVKFFEAIRISRFYQQDGWHTADRFWHPPQDDGNIIDQVALYLGCLPYHLCADQISVTDGQGERQLMAADDPLKADIYNCSWSDFACDKLVIHFNVSCFAWMYDEFERLATATVLDLAGSSSKGYEVFNLITSKTKEIQERTKELRAAAASLS